jgi:hypothetical protein
MSRIEAERQEAKDPTTTPARLRELFHSGAFSSIHVHLAKNPNIPADLLLKLGEDFPEQMMRNPAFELFSLENPAFFSTIPEKTLQNLSWRELPVGFARFLARHANDMIRQNIARAKETPEDVLLSLAQDRVSWVRGEVAKSARAPLEALQLFLQKQEFVFWVLSNPGTPAQILESFIRRAKELRRGIAENPSAPLRLLQRLAQDDSFEVREQVALNPAASAELLIRLARDPNEGVKARLAQHTKAPAEALAILARSPAKIVRDYALLHPNTPEAELRLAWSDPSTWTYLARNPRAPGDILAAMYQAGEWNVKLELANNPNTPQEVLRAMLHDGRYTYKTSLARNPSSPRAWLELLATDPDMRVREKTAQNPNTPANLLERLSVDREFVVRESVARHPSTAAEVRLLLCDDQSSQVRASAWLYLRYQDRQTSATR